jgi:hypothetical protein
MMEDKRIYIRVFSLNEFTLPTKKLNRSGSGGEQKHFSLCQESNPIIRPVGY